MPSACVPTNHRGASLPNMVNRTEDFVIAHAIKMAKGKNVVPEIGAVVPAQKAHLHVRMSTDEAKLNKLERAWLAHLREQRYQWLGIQNVTVKLADDCRLTPDFSYLGHDGRFYMDDVKGFQREDAFLKMKFAARQFSHFVFQIVTRKNGLWDIREMKP